MWIWIVCIIVLVSIVLGRSKESFYVGNNVVAVKFIKIVNSPYSQPSNYVDSVSGWQGDHENPPTKNQTAYSCWAAAAAQPEKYSAWGFRTDSHPDPNWRNTCFLYTKNFGPFNGNTNDTFHITGCVNPGDKVSTGCNSGPAGDRYLQISQVAAFDEGGTNVAKSRPTLASSASSGGGNAAIAVDGTLQPRGWPNIYHSSDTTGREFWQVELAKPTVLNRIEFYNRLDCCQTRALGYTLLLLASDGTLLTAIPFTAASTSANSTAMTFHLNTLAGVNGLAGPTGPAGTPGNAGAPGNPGAQGAPGATGPRGVAGLPGTAQFGPTGPTGFGATGPKGATGALGPTGSGKDGIPGPVGPTGSAGPYGLQGKEGPKGPTGPKGAKGDQGPMGKDALADGPDGTYGKTTLGSSKYENYTTSK